jgi:glucose-1-phosphate thymidylyltransferase
MKGIVLAGGKGTRLYPLTRAFSKQLLPVYDKPMIYYPIATLMAAGIREILVISTPKDQGLFESLLGDGTQYGVEFRFITQSAPRGLADALIVGEEFLGGEKCALILGDNLFHGTGLGGQLSLHSNVNGAHIFGYQVSNPEEYGVLELGDDGSVLTIQEKPETPKSNYAIPGLYFFDGKASTLAKQIEPGPRGEIEITSLLELYLESNELNVTLLPRGTAWFDTGTIANLHEASSYVSIIENRQGSKVACLEEISWRNKWISDAELLSFKSAYSDSAFGAYFEALLTTKN